MKDQTTSNTLLLLFIVGLISLFWILSSHSAPAPLPKRNQHPYIPQECLMHWGEQSKYHTTFYPNGFYQAIGLRECDNIWTGTWELKYDNQGGILTIKESHGYIMCDHYSTYVLRMNKSLRQSKDGFLKLE